MEKKFKSISELVKDEIFIKNVEAELDKARARRRLRPEAKSGFAYKRDWFDRFRAKNQLHASFFLYNIPSVWRKESALSSEERNVIQYICDCALIATNNEYESMESK